MAKKINITAQLNAATTDGILADAGQIFDAKKGKFQEQVNEEFENALDEAITSEDTGMVVESIEEGIVHNALRKTEQILTEAEKGQARENIGAVSEQTFENEAVRVKKQVFTSEQKYQARHNISAITAEEAEKIAQDKINETSVSSPDKLQAVKELSSWLEDNPESAATMNADIQENAADIQRLYRGTGIDEYSEFSTGMDYTAGSVVLYDGVLFRFKVGHAKGAWDYNEVEEWSEKKEREEKLSKLEFKTSEITKEIIETEEEEIIIEDNNGDEVAKINSTGANFKNLKSNGKDVITDISGKQDVIADLEIIRSGAARGATALQEHQDISGKADKAEVEALQDKTSEVSKETIEIEDDYIIIKNNDGNEVFRLDENGLNAKNVRSDGIPILEEKIILAKDTVQVELEEGYYTDDNEFDIWDEKYKFKYTANNRCIVNIPQIFEDSYIRVFKDGVLFSSYGYKNIQEITIDKGDTIRVNVKSSQRYTEKQTANINIEYINGVLPTNSKYHAELYLDASADDNSSSLSNLVDIVHIAGGGSIILPQCNYKFKSSIRLRSLVSIEGKGQGVSILTMMNGNKPYSLFVGDSIKYANFKDFSVNGYDMVVSTQSYTASNGKAFYLTNLEDCSFKNLCLMGTPATSLGIDFLNRVEIFSVSVIDGGRCWSLESSHAHGGSGIGIGMGKHYDENFVISNCVCVGCGNNGIFIEDQNLFTPQYSPMTGGSKQVIANNIVRDGRNNGIAARGCRNTIFANNVVINNANAGFSCDWFLDTLKLHNNILSKNKYGVFLQFSGETENVSVENNDICDNSLCGIYLSKADNVLYPAGNPKTTSFDIRNVAFIENKLYNNFRALVVACDIIHFVMKDNDEYNSEHEITLDGESTDAVFKNNTIFSNIINNMIFNGNKKYIEL